MHLVTHGLLSWLIADALPTDRRGRLAVTLAGILPDVDAFGAPVEMLSQGALPWFSTYHHRLLHNALAGAIIALAAWVWCRRDWRIGLAALGTFHLHLVCDLAGSRGPDGHDWPIPYLVPFTDLELRWSGQWALNAWPNLLTTAMCFALVWWFARRRGRTPLELVSPKLDARFVARLRPQAV